jgi:hypothetical protein
MVREVESLELVVVVMSVQLMHVSIPKYDRNRRELGTTDCPNETNNTRTKNTFWVSPRVEMNNRTRRPSDFSHTQ